MWTLHLIITANTSFLFPLPLSSLVSCSDGLKGLNQHHAYGLGSDAVFTSCVETHAMVLTTSSVRSLFPGVEMDNDVLNLCLKLMTCGASGVCIFGTGFLRRLFASPPLKWVARLPAVHNKLCQHSFMLFPFAANGYKLLFVVMRVKKCAWLQ